jgi:hypothetical protein
MTISGNEEIKDGAMSGQASSEDGVYMNDLAEGTILEIVTQRHRYMLIKRAGSQVGILGHPTFCPRPVLVEILGSFATWPITSSMPGFIGCDMFLMFKHPVLDHVITSRVLEIHIVQEGAILSFLQGVEILRESTAARKSEAQFAYAATASMRLAAR